MAVYPGAVYKPTTFGGRTPRNLQGRGILHVAVSGARSLAPWNQNTWHMYVAHDGYCEQYVDSAFRAYASGTANDDAFQIETAGGLGSSAVLNAERWTPAAAERLADIMAWLNTVDGTPLQPLPDSLPVRRGWGPHRLGIQHSRGVGAVPGWLMPGGERWSSAVGKECPGNAKVAQIPALIARAQQIRNGSPQQEDDMNPQQEQLLREVHGVLFSGTPATPATLSVYQRLVAVQGVLGGLAKTGGVDPGALASALRPIIAEAVQAGMAADNEDQADEIVDRLAARLGTPGA
jgi:hypothetical protein